MRRLLRENIGLKLLSLAIAIVLWVFVVGKPSSIVRAIPPQIQLLLERRLSRAVPVRVRFSEPSPAGYRVKDQQVRPARVVITGPESRVVQVEYVETEAVELVRAEGEKDYRVRAFVFDPQVSLESAPEIMVKVTMEKVPSPEAR
jgi:YbbR domain-containing protein